MTASSAKLLSLAEVRALAKSVLVSEGMDEAGSDVIAAIATCANCHHLGGLRFDTEPLAEAGLVALAVINSLSMVVPQGGVRPLFVTNPMSFACPREGLGSGLRDGGADGYPHGRCRRP